MIIHIQAYPETIHEDDDYSTPQNVLTIDFFASNDLDDRAMFSQWIGMWREPE